MSLDDHTDRCPSTTDLEALSAGRLEASKAAALEEHLTSCERCCGRLEEFGAQFFDELLPSETARKGEADDRSDILQQAINQLKSEPEVIKATSLAADDELATILATALPGDSQVGKIGPYAVRREVARGGMGIVLEAFDADLQRTVAIKVLSPSLASVAEFRDAFLCEARAAARLQHENVMPIYAVDQQGPLPYLVMPFVEGPTLQQRLDEHAPLPLEEVVVIGHQVSRALEAAHKQGLVHGDIKPANIMLLEGDGDCRVWLADFGLARAAGEQPFLGSGGGTPLAGTPAFMAPEQATGAAVDPRADLFAFGCVLYAMAGGGRSPFSTNSVRETLEKVCHGEPAPLRNAAPDLPDWLNRLIGQLLQKDPERRPETATVVRKVFEDHLTPRGVSRRMVLAGSVVAAAAISLAIWRPWEKTLPEGYLVGGNDVLHPTLAAAIEAAAPGDTVIVRRSGEIEVAALSLPADKALTIRAADGYHPIFVSRSWRKTMLESSAPLCLEGLEFRHPFADHPDEAAPILHCESAPVFLANCRFERSTSQSRPRSARHDEAKPILYFENCPQVELRNCEIYTLVGTNLALDVSPDLSEQDLRVENNLMVGMFGVRLEAPPASRHQWTLSRNSILGSVPLSVWTRGKRFPMVEVEYQRNLFDFLRSLLELRELEGQSTLREIRNRIRLTGTANCYRRTGLPGKRPEASFVVRTHLAEEDRPENFSIDTYARFVQAFGPAGRELATPVFDWKEIDAYRAKFSLMKAELFELKAPLAETGEAPGFDLALLGPGEPYRRWCQSESYQAWRRVVEGALSK